MFPSTSGPHTPAPRIRRLLALVALVLGALLAALQPIPSPSFAVAEPGGQSYATAPTARAGTIRFVGRTSAGLDLTYARFRALQTNNHPGADNDLLVDADTLRVRSAWPVYPDAGRATLDRPTGRVALSLSWPGSDGYTALLLDLPGPGTYDFSRLAATQVVREVAMQRRTRPSYRPSAAFLAASAAAAHHLAAGGTLARRQQFAALALDAALHAQRLLLQEFGRQFAAACRAPQATWGATITDRASAMTTIASVAALAAGGAHAPSVRLVFDAADRPATWAPVVTSARAHGVRVVGQLLDSSQMARLSMSQWRARVAAFVRGLPGVTTWEVGNEINGAWLGRDAATKALFAAAYVKRHSAASTLLTGYWTMGEDSSSSELFTWFAAHLPASTVRDIDQIGVSVYPEEHPLGASLGRVLAVLHAQYPRQRIAIAELGYRAADLTPVWWWGDRHSLTRARTAVNGFYTDTVMGQAWSAGGSYWWYFQHDAPQGSPLWLALRAQLRAGLGSCHRR